MTYSSTYLRVFSLSALVALVLPASVQASFTLGQAANYGAIAGPNTTNFTVNDATINGNVATNVSNTTAGGSYVAFTSGTINGNFDFSGTAQTNLGGGTITGSQNSNVAAVGTAYATISNLSILFSGEAGTNFPTLSTVNAESGTQDGAGNYVFTASTSTFLQRGAVVINGSASDYVVINVGNSLTDNNNITINSALTLTGGITSDHVFINVITSGQQFTTSLNQGILSGVITVLNSTINIDSTTVDGRVIGGGTGDFQIVSKSILNTPGAVPEPASIAMVILGGGMVGGVSAVHRRRLKLARATA